MTQSIERETVIKRVNGIQGEVVELRKLGELTYETFATGDGYKLAQYHLHRALEGVFNITGHILARIPGAQATQYKEMAQKLGEVGVIDRNFANTKLTEMAKYRNRLVHFYAEVTSQELFDLLQNDLGDIDVFLQAVKAVLIDPRRFNLEVE